MALAYGLAPAASAVSGPQSFAQVKYYFVEDDDISTDTGLSQSTRHAPKHTVHCSLSTMHLAHSPPSSYLPVPRARTRTHVREGGRERGTPSRDRLNRARIPQRRDVCAMPCRPRITTHAPRATSRDRRRCAPIHPHCVPRCAFCSRGAGATAGGGAGRPPGSRVSVCGGRRAHAELGAFLEHA